MFICSTTSRLLMISSLARARAHANYIRLRVLRILVWQQMWLGGNLRPFYWASLNSPFCGGLYV